MGKGLLAVRYRALLWLGLLGWLGCATPTPSPITGRHYQDITLKPSDTRFIAIREPGCFEYGKYLLVERFPNPALLLNGAPSRFAFERLGKATAISVDVWSTPPAEVARLEGHNVVMEWRTSAYWFLARRRTDGRIETLDITIQFVKLTRNRDEIQQLGSPALRGADTGWFIEKIDFHSGIHNPTSTAAKFRQ